MMNQKMSLIIEGLHNHVDEAVKKLTSKDILAAIKKDGYILLDDGSNKLVAFKLNDTNCDMSDSFKEQLTKLRYYDRMYVSVIIPADMGKCSQDYLPVYGNPSTWVTSWLFPTLDKAVDSMTRSRQIGVVKRANDYLAHSQSASEDIVLPYKPSVQEGTQIPKDVILKVKNASVQDYFKPDYAEDIISGLEDGKKLIDLVRGNLLYKNTDKIEKGAGTNRFVLTNKDGNRFVVTADLKY